MIDKEQTRRDAEKFPDRETATNWLIHKLDQVERRIDTLEAELRDCENTLSETRL